MPPAAGDVMCAPVVVECDGAAARKKKAPPTTRPIIFSRPVVRMTHTDADVPVLKRKAPPTEWHHPEPAVRKKKPKGGERVLRITSDVRIDKTAFTESVVRGPRLPPDQLCARHRPTTFESVLGNADAVKEAREWLASFEARERYCPRALLLVGPTGCGKTTLAQLLFGGDGYTACYSYSLYDYVEQKTATASEKRNGKTPKENYYTLSERGIEDVIHKLAGRSTVFGKFGIVLEDIGAMKSDAQKALVAVVSGQQTKKLLGKKSAESVWQSPFILTCDANELANISAVARVCCVVHLMRPTPAELRPYCDMVCAAEQLNVSKAVRDLVVEGCGGDVRRLLNTLQFFAVASSAGDAGAVIDCSTAFYDQCSNMDLVRRFLQRASRERLGALDDLADTHPVALSMLLAQNYPSMTTDLDTLAAAAEHVSSCDEMDRLVYGEFKFEAQDTLTVLGTWGIVKSAGGETIGELSKSDYYGWRQKESYRKKLMAAVVPMQERGIAFLDVGATICAHLAKHSNKTPQLDFVRELKAQDFSFSDIQDLWKSCHLDAPKLPGSRGQYALKKLLAK